jgi:hypothetical protein
MTSGPLPTGPFTCDVELRRIRAPEFVREDRQGVTYLVARGYEIAYEAALRFTGGPQLPIKARLRGELNQRIVIRDAGGRPTRMSGYVQGLVEINNADGHPIFRGHYYDSRTVQSLTGDDALTPTGQTVVDHFENGFGEGAYAGHAFSMGVHLIREGDGPLRGEGRGQID